MYPDPSHLMVVGTWLRPALQILMVFEMTKVYIYPMSARLWAMCWVIEKVRTGSDTIWLQYQKTSQDINMQSAGKL